MKLGEKRRAIQHNIVKKIQDEMKGEKIEGPIGKSRIPVEDG